MQDQKSIWALVGSERKNGSAENSGTLLLNNLGDRYEYKIADGNNRLVHKGILFFCEIENDALKKSVEQGSVHIQAAAAVNTIAEQNEIDMEYADLIGQGWVEYKIMLNNIKAAGTFIAVYNEKSTGSDDTIRDGEWAVIRTSDNETVGTFRYSGDAYEAMCELNLKAMEEKKTRKKLDSLPLPVLEAAHDKMAHIYNVQAMEERLEHLKKFDQELRDKTISHEQFDGLAKRYEKEYDPDVAENEQRDCLITGLLNNN